MDRLSDYIHNISLGDKRNIIASITAGALFTMGWWVAIDAAFAYPKNEDLLKSSHTCGALATLALIMINTVTNSQIRADDSYNEGFFGKTVARVWIFVAFLLSFGSLIAAIWIFFAFYVSNGKNVLPGVSILLQNVFLFASTQIFKFGRNEELWSN